MWVCRWRPPDRHHRARVCRYDSQIPNRFCSQVLHARGPSHGSDLAVASATSAKQSVHLPTWMAQRTARERCAVILRSARIVMGTALSPAMNWKVSLNNCSCCPRFLSSVSSSRVLMQRDNVYHAVAFSVCDKGSDVASRLVQCFLMYRNQGRLLQRHTLVLQQSQRLPASLPKPNAELPKGCPSTMPQLFSLHDLSGPNLSSFSEARLLQAANMTPERQENQVLSGKGCHVHGAELPTE